jgi:hypothetical protein
MRRTLAALGRFLWLAVKPGPKLASLLTDLGVTAVGVLVAVKGHPVVAMGVAGIAVALLLLRAGVRLQIDADDRARSDFVAVANLERGRWLPEAGTTVYECCAYAWIEVTNYGPTSQFAVRVGQVVGGGWGDNYRIIVPAWENQPSSVTEIERGGTRRVLLAAVLREPLAFWFYTSQAGHTGPGIVWFREEGVNDELTFPLEIVNTGDRDQTVRWNGRIALPQDIDSATFELTEAAATATHAPRPVKRAAALPNAHRQVGR